MEPPEAHLSHTVPGRSRWSIPSRKGDRAYFAEAVERLTSLPGVMDAEGRPLTGSLVIRHGGDPARLARQAEKAGLFVDGGREPTSPSLSEDFGEMLDRTDDWLGARSGGKLDLPTTLFLVFAGSAVIQLLRGNVAAPAATLGWYALNAFMLARTAASHRAFQATLGNGSEQQ